MNPSATSCSGTHHTDFADDLALISETIEQAQLFLLRVECNAAQVGLYVNEDKT